MKKLILVVAIFGGMLFTAEATNIIDFEDTTIYQKKPKIKRPGNG